MRDASYQESTEFLARFFGDATEHAVELRSFANEHGTGPARPLFCRDMELVEVHCRRWDEDGRGMFFGVCTRVTGSSQGRRQDLAECRALWVDIDCAKQGIAIDDASRALRSLPFPPSVIINSGGGLHAYWLLKEAIDVTLPDGAPAPTDTEAEIVAALKQLAGILAGDPKVCDLARVMRLPGTHNTKAEVIAAHGGPAPVRVLEASWATHDFSDLVEWLDWQRPVLKAPAAEAAAAENPYLAASRRMGFKAPVDVERALSEMSYGGQGDTSIHQTQLRVSASLAAHGVEIDDIAATLLEATRAASGDAGRAWNWQREEAAIRRMAQDARAKFGGREKVVSLAERRAKQDEAKANGTTGASAGAAPIISDKALQHIRVGSCLIEVLRTKGQQLLSTNGELWHFAGGIWACLDREDGKRLDVLIEDACRGLSLPSTARIVSETRQWLIRNPDLFRDEVPWDSHGGIPTLSGIVCPQTGGVTPSRPDHFSTWRLEIEYDAGAACPWWLRMLEDFLGDRPGDERARCIGLLQEIAGMSLVERKPRALTRALILEGPSESGKSRVLNVLAGLHTDRPISTPFDALAGTHGLMEFTRRAPWVLHEAFDQSRWHITSTVKAILTGDPVQINIKNGPVQTREIKVPVFWGTNHPPQFKEATKAIVNRLVIIQCRTVFSGDAPIGTAAEARHRGYAEPSDLVLATEKQGLLAWAVEGARRALARGYFEVSAEMLSILDEVRTDSNLVAGFIDDCAEFDPGSMVSTQDFCAAFSSWWTENKGDGRGTPSNDSIGRALRALANPMIGIDAKEFRTTAHRFYGGVRLNDVGLDHWSAIQLSDQGRHRHPRISSDRIRVNQALPSTWNGREAVRRMKTAHERDRPKATSDAGIRHDTSYDTSHDTSCFEVSPVREVSPKSRDRTPRF